MNFPCGVMRLVKVKKVCVDAPSECVAATMSQDYSWMNCLHEEFMDGAALRDGKCKILVQTQIARTGEDQITRSNAADFQPHHYEKHLYPAL
ncbi:hypothetical protein C0V97_14735 [Asaia sp. W19]|nr:hypothetical protein C0V97_17950 [Asaia sp. W19]RUT24780.1 hypothetical protein C0V97_14735 [Asaia sp. W19]